MPSSPCQIALFIDGANLHATAKALGFDIDYRRLLEEFERYGTSCAPTTTPQSSKTENIARSTRWSWLDHNGYTVITKPAKEFVDASGWRKVKGDMDIELAVGASRAYRPDRDLFRRRRLPLSRRSGAATGCTCYGCFNDFHSTIDNCRRAAPPGRCFH